MTGTWNAERMDPTTTVVLMTLNLIVTGGLVAMVARRQAETRPLWQCSASVWLFSAAYVARLALGLDDKRPVVALPDVAMVLAALVFLRGQRQFMARAVAPLSHGLAAVAVYGVVHSSATLWLGPLARQISLLGGLGGLYMAMAFSAWQGTRSLPEAEHGAQRLFMVVAGVLGVATLLRGLDAVLRGVDVLYIGPTAQAYYALSSICILLMGPAVLWWMFTRLTHELQRLATHDPLTGVLNRNGLERALEHHFGRRSAERVVWLLLDLDHFKRVNDTHGHGAGDRLLKAVARTVQGQVRAGDVVARLGGEEFVVGVLGADDALARTLAERLRGAVAATPVLAADGTTLRCTVSIGVSPSFAEPSAWEAALRSADDALYAAKRGGRDRVVVGSTALTAAPA
jgi:diguanylate cyclase (GGDEF)-like protein